MNRAIVLVAAALAACRGSSQLEHPFLWSVEKDGHTTYFFGTMHTGVDAHHDLPPIVWDKLDHASSFAMETDTNQVGKLDITRHDGHTLRSELGAVRWNALEEAVGANQANRIDRMKPYVAGTLLGTIGLPHTPPMDGELRREAEDHHESLVFLEPIEAQGEILEKTFDARTVGELLDDVPYARRQSQAMLDAYRAGDDAAVLKVIEDDRAESLRHGHSGAELDARLDVLLYARNAAWIPALEQLHRTGNGFVAVGTLHLVGARSVLDLLRQRGYKVTRLTP